jgi:NADH-quinone oxidoreductase subunit J
MEHYWPWIGFILLSLLTLGGAIMVVFARRLVHAALWLAVALLGVAGFFLTLGAEFIAGVQVLVYVGAIITLILFAIMFTSAEEEEAEAIHKEEKQ